jgi:hypothetical protein
MDRTLPRVLCCRWGTRRSIERFLGMRLPDVHAAQLAGAIMVAIVTAMSSAISSVSLPQTCHFVSTYGGLETGFEDGNRWTDLDRGHSDCRCVSSSDSISSLGNMQLTLSLLCNLDVSIASALVWKLTTMNTSPEEPDSSVRFLSPSAGSIDAGLNALSDIK